MDTKNYQMIPVDELIPNKYNPNYMSEEQYQGLVNSVKERNDVIKPIVVRNAKIEGGDVLIIVDGHHNWKAAKEAGLEEVPVEILEINHYDGLCEGIRRNEHGTSNPVLEGRLYRYLLEKRKDKKATNSELAKNIGKSEGTVRNNLLFADAADHCGEVEGWPTEEEIAKMSIREVRRLLERLESEEKEEDTDPAKSPKIKRMVTTYKKLSEEEQETFCELVGLPIPQVELPEGKRKVSGKQPRSQ